MSTQAITAERPVIIWNEGEIELEILMSDTGNARRLREEYGQECRFCLEEKVWYIWNDKVGVWQKDPLDLQIQFRTKLTLQKLRNEQVARVKELSPDLEKFRKKLTKKLEPRENVDLSKTEAETLTFFKGAIALEKWYTTSENAERIKAAVILLRSEPGMAVHKTQFDADPYLFNCINGTFDLRESTIARDHRREDFCSMMAPVTFDIFASERPVFEAFIKRVIPEDDRREFLQRFLGYCLSGLADERIMLFFIGTGSNGKGVLIRILCGLLGTAGGYAVMAPMSTFLQAKQVCNDETRNDLIALIGKRFVCASESNRKGPALDASLLKSFAGGDGEKSARENYGSMLSFQPSGKLILATNNEPTPDDDSDGFWSRVKKIWFEVQIPEAEQDPDLVGKIMATESAAVLAWFLEGWAAYWTDRKEGRSGLIAPASITADTQEYRDAQSQMAAWAGERADLDPSGKVSAADVYADFKIWCEKVGERPKSQRILSTEIMAWGGRHGVYRVHEGTGWYWHGLCLRNTESGSDSDKLEF